ncbi:hypothetical protein AVEN_4477-1 [Araneus ventricosus]|uniref:Uncharacterized protein n=1 Tax=Araneus ventricosus TaxID=182803 RepID=A0A4Y2WR22_ARAVE|nr:hypothetical protein AVEN_4477-1 [Araneus ventricosus]
MGSERGGARPPVGGAHNQYGGDVAPFNRRVDSIDWRRGEATQSDPSKKTWWELIEGGLRKKRAQKVLLALTPCKDDCGNCFMLRSAQKEFRYIFGLIISH